MKYQHRMIMVLLAIGFLVGIIPSTAQATPILTLSDGSARVEIVDDDMDGIVTWSGGVGDWSINFTTGITKPAVGSAADPILDIISLNVRFYGTSTTTLDIWFSEDGFFTTEESKAFSSNIEGFLFGTTLTYDSYLNDTELTHQGPFSGSSSGNSFSEVAWSDSTAPLNEFYSLSMNIAITSDGPFQGAGFSARLDPPPPTPIPEPATMLVLGTGLVGLTAFAIRKIYKK